MRHDSSPQIFNKHSDIGGGGKKGLTRSDGALIELGSDRSIYQRFRFPNVLARAQRRVSLALSLHLHLHSSIHPSIYRNPMANIFITLKLTDTGINSAN